VHEALTDIAALDTHWLELMAFAAAYYQRSVGEFALGSLPPSLRDLSRQQLLRKLDKRAKAAAVPAPHHPDALLP
jgi:primosomal protein N' (replication factor Y)